MYSVVFVSLRWAHGSAVLITVEFFYLERKNYNYFTKTILTRVNVTLPKNNKITKM